MFEHNYTSHLMLLHVIYYCCVLVFRVPFMSIISSDPLFDNRFCSKCHTRRYRLVEEELIACSTLPTWLGREVFLLHIYTKCCNRFHIQSYAMCLWQTEWIGGHTPFLIYLQDMYLTFLVSYQLRTEHDITFLKYWRNRWHFICSVFDGTFQWSSFTIGYFALVFCVYFRETTCTLAKEFVAYVYKASTDEEVCRPVLIHGFMILSFILKMVSTG